MPAVGVWLGCLCAGGGVFFASCSHARIQEVAGAGRGGCAFVDGEVRKEVGKEGRRITDGWMESKKEKDHGWKAHPMER